MGILNGFWMVTGPLKPVQFLGNPQFRGQVSRLFSIPTYPQFFVQNWGEDFHLEVSIASLSWPTCILLPCPVFWERINFDPNTKSWTYLLQLFNEYLICYYIIPRDFNAMLLLAYSLIKNTNNKRLQLMNNQYYQNSRREKVLWFNGKAVI